MSIKETFEVIKEAVTERISSPILGSFAFFFFGCNWKTAVILLKTNVPIEQAIINIEQTRMTWFHGFILPAILTVVFCFAYPWIKYYLSQYTDNIDAKRILKRQKVELKLIEARNEIIEAESNLEEIKERRAFDRERARKEFEYALQRREHEIDTFEAQRKIDKEMELERFRQEKAAQNEKSIRTFRQRNGI